MTTRFKDAKGREYDLGISGGASIRLEKELQINLRKHFDGSLYEQITETDSMFVNVLAIIANADLERHGLDREQFADALDGDAFAAAGEALIEAITGFSPPAVRPALQRIHEKTKLVERLGCQRMLLEADKLTEATIQADFDRQIVAASSERKKVVSGSSGNTSDSAEPASPTE